MTTPIPSGTNAEHAGSARIAVATIDVYVMRRVGDAWEMLLLERAEGTRCTGAWEVVHGRIEAGERPEHAAVREVLEETGFRVSRLYNVTVQPFYLQMMGSSGTVTLAVVFAAIVEGRDDVVLSAEHQRGEWLTIDQAVERASWPRSRAAMRDIAHLLRTGDAGPVEDVLRVL